MLFFFSARIPSIGVRFITVLYSAFAMYDVNSNLTGAISVASQFHPFIFDLFLITPTGDRLLRRPLQYLVVSVSTAVTRRRSVINDSPKQTERYDVLTREVGGL
jgi:hypothetical protein